MGCFQTKVEKLHEVFSQTIEVNLPQKRFDEPLLTSSASSFSLASCDIIKKAKETLSIKYDWNRCSLSFDDIRKKFSSVDLGRVIALSKSTIPKISIQSKRLLKLCNVIYNSNVGFIYIFYDGGWSPRHFMTTTAGFDDIIEFIQTQPNVSVMFYCMMTGWKYSIELRYDKLVNAFYRHQQLLEISKIINNKYV